MMDENISDDKKLSPVVFVLAFICGRSIQSAIAELTESEEAWKNNLRFASSIYKYSFDNTLLINSQNPEATMLAPLPVWNQIGRRVKFGAKSIAVCNFEQAITERG